MKSNDEVVYRLKKEEEKVLTYIEKPCLSDGKRLTKPIIVAFDKCSGNLVVVQTLTQWRDMCRGVDGYIDAYRFELRNLW